MNWDALGAVADLVSAVGVVASLVYLGVQIRRNSSALEAATNQAISDSTEYRLIAVAQSPELAGVWAKAVLDRTELSPSELVQRYIGSTQMILTKPDARPAEILPALTAR